MLADPLFGTLAANVVGQVVPPSAENNIVTFAQLIGEAVVLATFHVIVCELPEVHVTGDPCEVIINGPAAATVVTVKFISELHPATPVKSLATPLKLIVLPMEGTTSQVFDVLPVNIVAISGKYLVGLIVGIILRNTGPLVLVEAGGMV